MSRLRSYAPLRAKPKPSVDTQVRKHVMDRAGDRCEVVFTPLSFGYPCPEMEAMIQGAAVTVMGATLGRCPGRAVEPHHVIKRSQGGKDDPDNLIAVCRSCHDRTDWPYKRGRLVIRPLGQGRFECAIVTAPDKFALRALEEPK